MNRTIIIATGALAIILVGCAGSTSTPSVSTPAGPGRSTNPTPTEAAVPTASAIAAGSPAAPAVFDTRTIASDFALPMKATLPVGWKVGHDIVGTLGFLNVGDPEGPDSTWWGPDILLADDAQIHDPSDVISSEPAKPDRSRFVPWPDDFVEYITGLPDVTVGLGA